MKKLTAAVLFCLSFLFAEADTFIVTSNADSGPGTLREAITLANANGMSTVDYIHFNITDVSITGRTIAVLTSFPDLTSNLVIDGSTQPGSKIGVSDAKIKLTTAPGADMAHLFRIVKERNISFFGLHLDDLKLNNPSMITSAIALQHARNVLIGAPGKGNYFTRLGIVAQDAYFLPGGKGYNDSIAFKSNIANLSEDGNSVISSALLFAFDNVRNLTIGGEREAEGNFISTGREHIGWTYTDTNAHINTGTYAVLNNKFGCNYLQTIALPCGSLYLRNGNTYGFTDTTHVIIRGNTFNMGCYSFSCPMYNFIILDGKKGFIDIKANRFGYLQSNQDYFFSNALTAISIADCEDGIIGGDDPADPNIIAGHRGYAIALGGNKAIRITQNSILCNSNGIKVNSGQLPVPKTNIFTITDYLVQGTTLPKSKVEVFLTKRCAGCDNGEIYLGNTIADDTGGWSFNSPVLLDGAVTATGTSPLGVTGEFAKPEYGFDNYDYKHPTCNQNNGYIKGVRFVAGTSYYWTRNRNGAIDTLFTEDITNAGPGLYRFVVEQGKYCSTIYSQNLEDMSPKINARFKNIVQPSCGLYNGRITEHHLSGSYNKVMWKDPAGTVVGTTQELHDVGPGKYKLVILDTTYHCGDSTDFYTLTNQSGPSLLYNGLRITPAACSNQNGSITGITATNASGTPSLMWVDSLGNVVGTGFDLQHVPAGRYRLKFKDDGGCDTIITPFYVIENTGSITIDTTATIIAPAKCSGNTGSIRNLLITGADSYEWKNTTTGAIVGNTPDVFNLAVGSYQLTATNGFGCSQTIPPMAIQQTKSARFDARKWVGLHATCNRPNGFIELDPVYIYSDTTLYTYRWVDSATGRVVGTHVNLYNVWGGTYLQFAKDSNGCEEQIMKVTLENKPLPSFDFTNLKVTPDQCLSGVGAIQGVAINDLWGTSVSYIWRNENGDTVGYTASLGNLPPGSYTLQATNMGCTITSQPVVVSNVNVRLTNPVYEEQMILKGAAATLSVKNPQPGTYQLFDSPTATTPLQQNTTGNFMTPVLSADKVFYVRYVNGVCASGLVPVAVKVFDKTAVYVPTAFTPNGDGKNDVLKAIPFGRIRLIHFTVYNRWGEVVFSTENFSKGWNGTRQGHPAETGVYVWLVKAVDETSGKNIEEKGTVMVIR